MWWLILHVHLTGPRTAWTAGKIYSRGACEVFLEKFSSGIGSLSQAVVLPQCGMKSSLCGIIFKSLVCPLRVRREQKGRGRTNPLSLLALGHPFFACPHTTTLLALGFLDSDWDSYHWLFWFPSLQMADGRTSRPLLPLSQFL